MVKMKNFPSALNAKVFFGPSSVAYFVSNDKPKKHIRLGRGLSTRFFCVYCFWSAVCVIVLVCVCVCVCVWRGVKGRKLTKSFIGLPVFRPSSGLKPWYWCSCATAHGNHVPHECFGEKRGRGPTVTLGAKLRDIRAVFRVGTRGRWEPYFRTCYCGQGWRFWECVKLSTRPLVPPPTFGHSWTTASKLQYPVTRKGMPTHGLLFLEQKKKEQLPPISVYRRSSRQLPTPHQALLG